METSEQPGTSPSEVGWRGPLLGGLLAALFWSPMATLPFYHDDWGALYAARESLKSGQSWLSAFAISNDPGLFWRPLSVTLHWRMIAGIFHGSALAAHIINLVLLAAGCAAVGNLAATIANAFKPVSAQRAGFFAALFYGGRAGFFAALFYGIHGAMFLPMAWASGAQEFYAILFSALCLKGFVVWVLWFGKNDRSSMSNRMWAVSCPIFLALALLSKEGAAVLPALAIVLAWMLGTRPKSFGMPIVCAVVWIAWFGLRMQRVAPVPACSPYSYHFGFNFVRNFCSLALFSMNLPREAPQLAVLEPESRILAIAWGVVCAAPLILSGIILVRAAVCPRKTLVALVLFWLVGILPVLALAWNCYPYYALIGLMGFAVLIAIMCEGPYPWCAYIMLALSLGSLFVLMVGEVFLDFPAPLASMRWGDEQLKILEGSKYRGMPSARYHVALDERSFGAMGNEFGIATALGVSAEQIAPFGQECPDCDFEILISSHTRMVRSLDDMNVPVRDVDVVKISGNP